MKKGLVAAGGATLGARVLTGGLPLFGEDECGRDLTKGDIAVLRHLAAVEEIEADLWQQ
jgi:hypothetical protein